jgi:hypothetical protein
MPRKLLGKPRPGRKLERYLVSDDRLERPKHSWQIKAEFLIHPTAARMYSYCRILLSDITASSFSREINLQIRGPEGCIDWAQWSRKNDFIKNNRRAFTTLEWFYPPGTNLTVGYMSQEQEILDLRLSSRDLSND